MRTTVGVVLPFSCTLNHTLDFLNRILGHTGHMGYAAEKAGVFSRIQLLAWILWGMCLGLLCANTVYDFATGQVRQWIWILEIYDILFLSIILFTAVYSMRHIRFALPSIQKAPSDESKFLALMGSLIGYREVIGCLYYARDIFVGVEEFFEEEEVPLWPMD